MEDLKDEIDRKKARLEALTQARSKADCSTSHSSKDDVLRETEIDDLLDEIKALEMKLNKK
ncbi:MAG TPA: hypothetical protein VMZ05_03845 [Spirochaetota bacterium]|nr:hypothetical protein [Spirochaetota bacterium]